MGSITGMAIVVAFPVLISTFNSSLITTGWVLSASHLTPASNNASIELMPDRVATISGLRGIYRQTGGALGVTLSTLIMHNVGDLARGFHMIFWGMAGIMLLSVPLILAMPSSPRVTHNGSEPGGASAS
jgi:hypothetical protein